MSSMSFGNLSITDCTRPKPHDNPCNGWATIDCYGLEAFVASESAKATFYGACQHHCCIIHGCKYGLKDCPVVCEILPGTDPDSCMDCMKDKRITVSVLR